MECVGVSRAERDANPDKRNERQHTREAGRI